MKALFVVSSLFAVAALGAAEQPSALNLQPSTFVRHIPEGGMAVSEEDGGFRFKMSARGYRKGGDGYVSAAIPLLKLGRLDFDVKVDFRKDNHDMALFLSFYNVHTFWHDACKDWRVVTPMAEAHREKDFNNEPVFHRQMAMFEPDKWHHCRIWFDQAGSRVEFYLDDMSDPCHILGDWSVWGVAEYQGGELRFGGMGASLDSVYHVKNIVLTEEKPGEAAAARTETLVFDGLSNDYYDLTNLLKDDKPHLYTLAMTRSSYTARNFFRYTGQPGQATIAAAKRIVFADAPLGPEPLVPEFVLADIVASVKGGAELIVLDGPMSLKKGCYDRCPLAEILPEGALDDDAFARHDGAPQLLERTVGKGVVKVLKGIRLGASPERFHAEGSEWRTYAEKLF